LIEMSCPIVDNTQNLLGELGMNTETENLVRLDQWKNDKKENSFSDYLKVLSFNDLMNESDALMNQIKSCDTDDLFSKTRVMMSEFTNRLEKESKMLAVSVKDFKKQIEDKLH
jgi:hypothetical protein